MKKYEGWVDTKLEEVCRFQNGFAFKSNLFRESGCPILRISNIQNDGVETRKLVFFNPKDYRENLNKYRVVKDDLLIAMSGATTGKLGFNTSSEVFYLNQRVGKFEPSKRLNKWFLYYFLSTRIEENLRISAGAAQPNLSTEQIKGFVLPLPPLPEQQRIVGILDEACDGIATAKAHAEKNLQNARALFESYLQAVFTQRGERWAEKPLAELCDIKHGFAFKSEFFASEGDYVVLTPGNFYESGGYRDRGEKQKYYSGEIPRGFVLDKGDLLVAMTEQAAGLLGSPILVPESNKFLHNQRLGLVTKKPGVPWTNEFFFHVFNTQAVRKEIHDSASGVKVRHTSPTKIGDVIVSFPMAVSEQRAIVSNLADLREETQRLESIYQRKLAAFDELKKSLLYKAFNGEL